MKHMCTRRKVDHSEHGIKNWVSLSTHYMTELLLFSTERTVINKVVVCGFSWSGAHVCLS